MFLGMRWLTRPTWPVGVGVSLLLLTSSALAHGPIPPQPVEWEPGRLLIQLAPAVDPLAAAASRGDLTSDLAALNARFGVYAARAVLPQYAPVALEALDRSAPGRQLPAGERALMDRLGRWVLLEVDAKVDVQAMVEAYEALDEVERAEPDYLARVVEGVPSSGSAAPLIGTAQGAAPDLTPNDPRLGEQWGLAAIDAPGAWEITQGSPTKVIAIIDTGVDLDHPDLAAKIWINSDEAPGDSNGDTCPGICSLDDDGDGLIDEDGAGTQKGEPGWDAAFAADDDENGYIDDFRGWDWIGAGEGFEDNDPQDDNGHGTHCAGIAAAATHNFIGIAGACPLCTVMPLKAFQSSGSAAYSDIALAIDYARRNGAKVISMSFGSYADAALVRDALGLAYSSSVLVAAAGNDSQSRVSLDCGPIAPFFPAAYNFVLGVEASTSGGARAQFSNCQYEVRVPGAGILSTVLDDSYTTWSGTSMAAPLLAGTAGLLRALHDVDLWGPDLYFGQLARSGGNALQALTIVPIPDLRLVEFAVVDAVGSCPSCDGDGRPDSGETVDIAVTVRNWWGHATDVTGTLSTIDPLATVLDAAADWGAIGPNATDDNADNPFRVEISSAAGNNRDVVFDLAVSAGNGGTGVAEPIVLTVQRGVEKGGILSLSETWTSDNLYLVTDNLLVMPGVTLTIEPGTRIQIDPTKSIAVRGELVARGTSTERITFAGNPDNWGAIWFRYESTPATFDGSGHYLSGSILEYCVVRDTSYGSEALRLEGSPYIAKNIFTANHGDYINVIRSDRSARIEQNLLVGNGAWMPVTALWIMGVGGRVAQNTVVGNASGGLLVPSAGEIVGNNLFSNGDFEANIYPSPTDWSVIGNYWGTTDPMAIANAIIDFFDGANLGVLAWDPPLAVPDPAAPPVVADITLAPVSPVSVGLLTFTITFSHPMRTDLEPEVSFGPAAPWTSHPANLNGHWVDPVTYEVQTSITVFTGDGNQKITVVGAMDPENFPIPTGDHRFGFEIRTSGTSAAALQAAGGIGHVDLDWFPSTLPDVAGYNLYRAEHSGGPYTRLNGALVVDTAYVDSTAEPGVESWYIYRVVNTEVEEGPDSDEASAAALDDIPPVIEHTSVTSAPAGLPITIVATVTDNVATPTAKLYHRALGSSGGWLQAAMVNATGSQYTANIPAGDAIAPGREYYLEASDGVSTVQHGTPGLPHAITILDRPTVADVTPIHGPLGGGTAVTITGTNFQPGATVRFSGVAASGVARVDSQTLTCTAPAHYPAAVDVAVTNPNTAVGMKTRAYTYDGTATIVRLPTVGHDRMTTTTLGVTTPGVEGMISATLEFTFDPAVLTVQSAAAGTLIPGWSVSANTATPGRVRLALAGTAPVTGVGGLAQVTVQVVGDPAAVTPLVWVEATLNEGAIPVSAEGGQVTVNNAFDISGTVRYYAGGAPVAGVTMTLDGSASYSQATALEGTFALQNVPSDNYLLSGSKSGGVAVGHISALDASLVLQHDAGLITLGAQQRVAGDVNGSGQPTAFDASLILQYAVGLVGLPFPGAGRIWTFDPPSRAYTPLDLDQTNQDFAAILIGDPTGNWSGGGEGLDGSATLALQPSASCGPTGLKVRATSLSPGAELYALELTLSFDPATLVIGNLHPGTATAGWTLVVNSQPSGELRIAMAGSTPVSAAGDLLEMDLALSGTAPNRLTATRSYFNEGRLTTNLPAARLASCDLFADGFESGGTSGWSAVVP